MSILEQTPFFLSPTFCAHNMVLVITQTREEVSLGLLDIENIQLKRKIEKAWPQIFFSYSLLSKEAFTLGLSRLFAEEGLSETEPTDFNGNISSIDRIEDDAPIINLLNSIFLEAVSLKASDIHIESEFDQVLIRYRVDGRLRTVARLSSERGQSLSARLKHLANLNIIEKRRPQDGRIDLSGMNHLLDVRISIAPTVKGESIVLRLLNASDSPLTLGSLGFSSRELGRITDAIGFNSGLILVTGPTGSGKTTTLSAILREIKNDEIKIISIEDPVEYRLEGITQIQTDESLDLTFDALLRRVFRQDPDIIMIGEIRDSETAQLAVRAALTGHLVFATLHTTGALETIPRLMNLGVETYIVATVLKLVVAQRLLRRVCRLCGGSGCLPCGKTGYSGRVAVSETLSIGSELRKSLETDYSADIIEKIALRTGFLPLRNDASEKVALGITDEKELKREIGVCL